VALLAYGAIAVLYNWPLPRHLRTELTGLVTGDTGVYVWNQWLFRHEIVAHRHFPLFTQEILSLTPPVDLSLHNYTLFANLLAFPLIPIVGVTASFNLIYLALVTLTAWSAFVLARSVIGRTGEAWLAGLMFGFSPVLVARSEDHFSLIAAAPLPLFVLALIRAVQRRDRRYAALAGVVVAWAATCDVYYGIFCILIALVYLTARCLRLRYPAFPPAPAAHRAVAVLMILVGIVIVVIVATGGVDLRFRDRVLALRSLYTPVLLLVVLAIVRAGLVVRPVVVPKRLPPARDLAKMAGLAFLGCALLLSPVLFALGHRLSDGGELHGPIFWRSSPPGVDLLALFAPNPNHSLFGAGWRTWLTNRPGGYVENVASLTIVGLLIVALAVWRYRFRPPRTWTALTLFFAAVAVGPFIHVAGANTYVIGPWALLRYVPIISATRTPTRYAIVAMLGFSVVFGLALARIARRHPSCRRALLVVVGAALAFELAPFPRTTHSAHVPDIYGIVADDPRDVRVLELPFGIRDGEWSQGDFNAASQFYQTYHQKPLIGGYLSRISDREVERQRQHVTIRSLIRLSVGQAVDPADADELKRRAPTFLQRAQVGYVVMHTRRVKPALRRFAIETFRLEKVGESDGHELYVPRDR
jgi:hypothetical protein